MNDSVHTEAAHERSLASVVRLTASKLPLVPRYRQRVRFVPLDLGRPVWVDDPTFNLAYHVRHTALAPPGGEAELEDLMGQLMSQELDRSRPLWEAWMVEGFDDGRWAIISKVHHCMVDGVAGADLIGVLLDATPAPSPPVVDDWRPQPEPSSLRLVIDAIGGALTSQRDQLRAVRAAATAPRRALERAGAIAAGLRAYIPSLRATPTTSLDGRIGAHRRWTCARAALDDVRTIRHTMGGTVNDVVLAAITSGFRDLVLARGEDPEAVELRTLVPVSVRDESARGITDNRVSAIFFNMPIAVAGSCERLEAVRAEMGRLKASHEPEAGEAITAFLGALPPAITLPAIGFASRLSNRMEQRTMNTVTTNVPGPQVPLYALGREMVEYLPFVPLGPSVRIGVAIISYNGRIAFGITGDFDTAADISVLADGIEREIAALVQLAAPRAAS
jgi:diacylglycerol O-acyltransferase